LSLAQGTNVITAYVTVFDVLVKNDPANLASLAQSVLLTLLTTKCFQKKTHKTATYTVLTLVPWVIEPR
jgi:hypothetical protein